MVARVVVVSLIAAVAVCTVAKPQSWSAPSTASSLGVLSVTAERTVLNLGVDAQTHLTIRLSGPEAVRASPLRARATAGTVSEVVRAQDDPGAFTAIYRPPTEVRPQAVIIVVEMGLPPDGPRMAAATTLTLEAPTRFPLRTSPRARVTIEVQGRVFGPVLADELGQVVVPILVPPGVATGTARAVNDFGVAKETAVDLQSLDYARILLLAAPRGQVGSESLVEVWGIEPSGEPSNPEDMDLGASAGKVRRVGGAAGLARFAVSLPEAMGSGSVSLIASMNDGSSTDGAALALVPGPPTKLFMTVDPLRLAVGSQTHASVTITARDRFDNAVEPTGVVTTVEGVPVPVQVAPDVAVSYVPAPSAWRVRPTDGLPASGDQRLRVRAKLGTLGASGEIMLTGGEPASATLTTDRKVLRGNGRDAAEIRLRIFDVHGVATSAAHIDWRFNELGEMKVLPATSSGDYRARFSPRRTIKDSRATLVATVDDQFSSSMDLRIEGAPARTLTARVGVATNLGSTLGPAVFLDAAWPLRIGTRWGDAIDRLVALGVSMGYVHADLTTASAEGVRLELHQWPLLALARLRIPFAAPAEVFVSGVAGMTLADLSISAFQGMGAVISRASARGVTVGLGAEAALPLDPGQLIFGARYLRVDLGRTSEQDRLEGNSLGWICDLGFRLGF